MTRWAAVSLGRVTILPQPSPARMAKPGVAGPVPELGLTYEHRLHPAGTASVLPGYVRDRQGGSLERGEVL